MAQTEGPYYTPNTPERISLLEDGITGTNLLLSGFVPGRNCAPIARALIDFWHCDNEGNYDNEGYRLRGHQFTGPDGSYRFDTIVPGLYPGRTRHFHLKFQAADRPVLTTQFYFPGEPDNQRDGIFRPELLLRISEAPEQVARFDTVLDLP